jgi:GGDEF domain-containing protein
MVAGRIRISNALIKENSPVMQELKKQVYVDKMTGIYNKTYMEEKYVA